MTKLSCEQLTKHCAAGGVKPKPRKRQIATQPVSHASKDNAKWIIIVSATTTGTESMHFRAKLQICIYDETLRRQLCHTSVHSAYAWGRNKRIRIDLLIYFLCPKGAEWRILSCPAQWSMVRQQGVIAKLQTSGRGDIIIWALQKHMGTMAQSQVAGLTTKWTLLGSNSTTAQLLFGLLDGHAIWAKVAIY